MVSTNALKTNERVPYNIMRILQLVTTRQRRGAEVFATDLSDALAKRGHEVTILGLSPCPEDVLSPRSANALDLRSTGNGRLHLSRVFELRDTLRTLRPDIIQANGGTAMKYAALALRLFPNGSPLVYRSIGFSSDWLRLPGQRRWNGWLMSRASQTVTVSHTSRRDLIHTYGIRPDKVSVIYRGVNTEEFYARDQGRLRLEQEGIPSDAFILFHAGSFSSEKNHAGLLEIAHHVRRSIPTTHVVLAGDGSLRRQIESSAPHYVHFLGIRSDVSTLMAGSDVFVLPSHTEGLPGTVLEAGLQGVPSVAYDVGGVREVVEDGVTGRVIKRGDAESAAKAIIRLFESPDQRNTLGEAARQKVIKNHSLDASCDAFEALYFGILSNTVANA